jgi:thioredoxin reductase (NADPH)
MSKHHTIVIGGGPGGASAAIYLARFNHDVTLIDAGNAIPGRTRLALHLQNVLGFTKTVAGPDYLNEINRQLRKFGVTQRKEIVTEVKKEKDGSFTVKTDRSATYTAEFVIIAVGVYDIMPDIPDIETYFGHSIFSCPTCNWYQTKDMKTGIISNEDSGITSALAFHAMEPGSCLFVAPDRPKPHFSDKMIAKAKAVGIDVYTDSIVAFKGRRGMLNSVILADETEIPIEILYTKLGVKRHDTFFDHESIHIKRDEDGYIVVDFEHLTTSEKNIYAVGPCNIGPDQVMVAAGQGVSAAMSIHRQILTERGV